jgi:hypothetical protein
MAYVVLIGAVASFVLGIRLTRLIAQASAAVSRVRQSAAIINAVDIDDDRKEAAAREAAIGLTVAFASILARSAIAVALAVAVTAAAVAVGVTTQAALEAAMLDPFFVIGSTVALIAAWRIMR